MPESECCRETADGPCGPFLDQEREIERLRVLRLHVLLKRCQFRIYGVGGGTDDLFRDLYAVTNEK